MPYKTMILELLQQHQELHSRLAQVRQLLPTMDRLALHLKSRHQAWQNQLATIKPDSDRTQIQSEALELALQEFQDRLCAVCLKGEKPLSLEDVMTHFPETTPPD